MVFFFNIYVLCGFMWQITFILTKMDKVLFHWLRWDFKRSNDTDNFYELLKETDKLEYWRQLDCLYIIKL